MNEIPQEWYDSFDSFVASDDAPPIADQAAGEPFTHPRWTLWVTADVEDLLLPILAAGSAEQNLADALIDAAEWRSSAEAQAQATICGVDPREDERGDGRAAMAKWQAHTDWVLDGAPVEVPAEAWPAFASILDAGLRDQQQRRQNVCLGLVEISDALLQAVDARLAADGGRDDQLVVVDARYTSPDELHGRFGFDWVWLLRLHLEARGLMRQEFGAEPLLFRALEIAADWSGDGAPAVVLRRDRDSGEPVPRSLPRRTLLELLAS